MKNFLSIILSIGGVVFLAFMFIQGLEKQAEVECIKWQSESERYHGYYFTDWQIAQCEAHGIELSL